MCERARVRACVCVRAVGGRAAEATAEWLTRRAAESKGEGRVGPGHDSLATHSARERGKRQGISITTPSAPKLGACTTGIAAGRRTGEPSTAFRAVQTQRAVPTSCPRAQTQSLLLASAAAALASGLWPLLCSALLWLFCSALLSLSLLHRQPPPPALSPSRGLQHTTGPALLHRQEKTKAATLAALTFRPSPTRQSPRHPRPPASYLPKQSPIPSQSDVVSSFFFFVLGPAAVLRCLGRLSGTTPISTLS